MQDEVYGNRDLTYSAWHRRRSTQRFVGIESAQLLAMCDIDVAAFVEYDENTKRPVALVETARDVGQDYKCATVTRKLAKMANIPAYVVLYTPAIEPNPADDKWPDIEKFRVKQLTPKWSANWHEVSPEQWAKHLLKLRREECQKCDELINAGLE